MKKIKIGISTFGLILSVLSAVWVYAGNKFSWPMFVPATAGVGLCDAQNIERCRNETDCLKYGGDWYNKSCNQSLTCSDIAGCYSGTMSDNCPGYQAGAQAQVSINSNCSFSGVSQYGVQITGTITDRQGVTFSGSAKTDANGCGQFTITCTDSGTSISCGFQYANGRTGSIIKASQGECRSVNNFLTETLAGYWNFSYTIITAFSDSYYLDSSSVMEHPSGSDKYYIFGEDEYGNMVNAGYDPETKQYALLDPGSIIDILFAFNYTNTNSVSGCYYHYSHNSNSWTNCYPMTGIRTSTNQTTGIKKSQENGTEIEQQLLEEFEAQDQQGIIQLPDEARLEMLNNLRDRLITE